MPALDETLAAFRAIGEETRLRIMALLAQGELTVSELTQILAQSQPRVSRHLKILSDAMLVERHREGSWMFYRRADAAGARSRHEGLSSLLDAVASSDDRTIERDRERFAQSRRARAARAARYFRENAAEWSRLRALHSPEAAIETAIVDLVGDAPMEWIVDLGTGTGRMLELLAPLARHAVGYDLSHEMLEIARANLDQAGLAHAQARHGDLFATPLESDSVDLVIVHQVLHFLAEPDAAVREAGRLLKPGGRLIVSDFAPHDLEFLRDKHAHRRLGFSDREVGGWCDAAGLELFATQTLSPPPKGVAEKARHDKLTVKVWASRAPAAVSHIRARRARLKS